MTKFEYLRQCEPLEVICTWKALGESVITSKTKIYSANMVYRVEDINSSLNEFLLYCKKDYVGGNINWAKATYYDSDFGEISFGDDIVSPYFGVVLANDYDKETATYTYDYDAIMDTSEFTKKYTSFFPYRNLKDTGKVIISEEDYQRCISVLGAPFITEEELDYSRDEITELAIKPALEEYFHWLPPTKFTSVSVGTNEVEVDMPSDTYAVLNIQLQQTGTGGNYVSPVFYAMEQALYGGYSYGGIKRPYNTSSMGMRDSSSIVGNMQNRALQQALVNYSRRVHYEGPYRRADDSQYIKVYSNIAGTMDILWARKSLDFNDVAYAQRTRVFEYAQACIKELFANLRRQSKSDLPGHIDYNTWLTEAKETKDRITGEYKKLTKYAGILRGSL